MARVESLTYNSDSTVTIWWEGSDIQSDYFNMMSHASQRSALRYLASDGHTPGCFVQCVNPRERWTEEPQDYKRAKAFARKAGLPFRDKVYTA